MPAGAPAVIGDTHGVTREPFRLVRDWNRRMRDAFGLARHSRRLARLWQRPPPQTGADGFAAE